MCYTTFAISRSLAFPFAQSKSSKLWLCFAKSDHSETWNVLTVIAIFSSTIVFSYFPFYPFPSITLMSTFIFLSISILPTWSILRNLFQQCTSMSSILFLLCFVFTLNPDPYFSALSVNALWLLLPSGVMGFVQHLHFYLFQSPSYPDTRNTMS